METAKQMLELPGSERVNLLNHAIASFNVKAQDLERSYLMLSDQVKHLNKALEEKNRQLEKNLQEKEQVKNFLSSILESLPTGVVVTDLSGKILMCNSAVERITGTCLSGMNSRRVKEWFKKLQLSDCFQQDAAQVYTLETEFLRRTSDVRSLKVIQSPVIGTNHETIGILFIIQDQTHLKKLVVQSERDKRLKAMGEMAIRIAHEVRNPLGSIELLASIMRSELEEREDLHKMSDRIITEVKSLDNSISNLLLFTRPQQPFLHEVNLTEFFDEYIEFIQPVVSKNGVDLIYKPHKENFFVTGDKDLLKQVFLNLTLNALQAMGDHGSIKIGMQAYNGEQVPDTTWVEICFSDTGEGIEPEVLNKIFNPFYTTKEKGTGLGLAIVHNIIESHNGTIEARSKLKKGTIFIITLPAKRIDRHEQRTLA
ncbi:MAG: ATP-binding protein [Pseudomonadota bacterium]